jgi:hypothetical protein
MKISFLFDAMAVDFHKFRMNKARTRTDTRLQMTGSGVRR